MAYISWNEDDVNDLGDDSGMPRPFNNDYPSGGSMAKRTLGKRTLKKPAKEEKKVVKKMGRGSIKKLAKAVVKTKSTKRKVEKAEISVKKVLSTGSTLLDLAISGGRVRGGGVPGGIIVEIFGPSGAGKTAILAELGGSCQYRGGDTLFLDPESRLDQEYAEIYKLDLKEKNYHRPDTVREMFKYIYEWEPEPEEEGAINMVASDSLAAYSTEMEMEEIDKMGMKRAKDYSEGLRKTARIIANNNWLIACSNQERDNQGMGGPTTPGGKAIPYYASLRIRIYPALQNAKLVKEKKVGKKVIKKVIGIQSICEVRKSSVDEPWRQAPIVIKFGLGIDDVHANLQWMKDMTGNTKYDAITKEYVRMDDAIKHVEEHNLEKKLRKEVIDLWETIEKSFKTDRKRKPLK